MRITIPVEIEIVLNYEPPRPAPYASDPDSNRYSDDGDGGKCEIALVTGDLPQIVKMAIEDAFDDSRSAMSWLRGQAQQEA